MSTKRHGGPEYAAAVAAGPAFTFTFAPFFAGLPTPASGFPGGLGAVPVLSEAAVFAVAGPDAPVEAAADTAMFANDAALTVAALSNPSLHHAARIPTMLHHRAQNVSAPETGQRMHSRPVSCIAHCHTVTCYVMCVQRHGKQ